MARIDNEILVNAPIQDTWEITNDVTAWPRLFTEYADLEVLERNGDTVRFRLTMRPDENGQAWSWVSERTMDPLSWTVSAHRVETGPFQFMNIWWSYEPEGDATRMRWVQEFTMKPDAPLDDDAMARRLNDNTLIQMAAVARGVERTVKARGATPA